MKKRTIIIICSLFILIFIVQTVVLYKIVKLAKDRNFGEELSLFYEYGATDGKMVYGVNEHSSCCFVGECYLDDSMDSCVITIPDTFEGKKVIALGGYFGRGAPVQFYLEPLSEIGRDPEIEMPKPTKEKTIDVTVNIGKNIKTVDNSTPPIPNSFYRLEGEECILVKLNVSFNCDADNRYFYSKDGKLYSRSNDEIAIKFGEDDE